MKAENKILESRLSDLKLKFQELTNENEISVKTIEYYKKALNNSREDYSNLIKLFTETQEKLMEVSDPKHQLEGPQGLTIKKLELKIEWLNLINKNLNEQIIDSNKLVRKIEQIWVKEVEKFEEVMRTQLIAARLILKEPKGVGCSQSKSSFNYINNNL